MHKPFATFAGKLAAFLAILALNLPATLVNASSTDLATAPMATSTTTTVRPNLMFLLDDSGSMAWDYLPDYVNDSNKCKRYCTNSSCSSSTTCQAGDPPYYSSAFNGVFYNAQITYKPGVNYDGTSKANQSATAAMIDAYDSSSGTINLTTNFPEIVYCDSTTATATDSTHCKRNGIDVAGYGYPNNTMGPSTTAAGSIIYHYNSYGTNTGSSNPLKPTLVTSSWNASYYKQFVYPKTRNGNAFYYTISPVEYCDSASLVNCVASTTPTGVYVFPAPVRFCKASTDAWAAAPVSGQSGGANKCQAKFDATNYTYARYGTFTRTDIVSTTPTYGNRPNRTDCAAAPNCTYAEEITNFANWYSYYRTRMQMMKTSAGQAFLNIDNKYRVGFLTINPGSPVSSSKYLKIDTFDATHKSDWYIKFYSQIPNNSTPLRQALSRVGRHFAGKTDGINSGMPDDPMQYSCQQNFVLVTTDGYWNGSSGEDVQLDGTTAVGNQDNVDSGWSMRAIGAYDGGGAAGSYSSGGFADTLADVAMYYYKTDLRPTGSTGTLGIDVSQDNVPTSAKDTAAHQHMTTFSLGLADGYMTFQPDYETATTGDFAKIKSASTGCSWLAPTATCNWPMPLHDTASALDDLWHAAVNGRGSYYNARDPSTLSTGITNALTSLKITTGAAAASATSSPNITQTERAIFSSTYRTVKWDGEVVSQLIDPASGDVLPTIQWSAQTLLDTMATATSDTRTIYTLDTSTANKLKPFLWANLSATEQAYFNSKCSTWSQCVTMTSGQQTLANTGSNLLAYLRGQNQYTVTPNPLYRARDHILGDTVNATPAYIKVPRFNFGDAVTPSYATFQANQASRQGVLYIAANDGMLHAFNSDTGQEMWSYVPKMVMPNLYMLAENNYATTHQYFVDGSPQTMDVFSGGAWHTILVGGLNSGGRGFYALDVTDPANPQALWEICSDSALCAISDVDLGYSFGNPVITKRPSDGKWVVLVTSGYNNVSPGNAGHGILFMLDAMTGAVLQKIDTGAGSTTTPSGLAKISAWASNGNIDNTSLRVYGGDLLGNVWRFDLTTTPPSVMRIASLNDATGKPQSITTRPELGLILGQPVVFVGTGRYLGVTDLADPATLSPPQPYAYQQSFYALKDTQADLGNARLNNMIQQTITQPTPTTRTITGASTVDWNTKNGWFVDFNLAADGTINPAGERVNIDPQLYLGTLLVTTNVPNSNACTVGGDSWLYQFDYTKGIYVSNAPNQTLASKVSNALTVGNVVIQLPSGALKIISTSATGAKTPSGLNAPGVPGSGKRVSWRELIN